MYKSKSDREDERWMLEDEAIRRIKAADACDEQDARQQLQKLKADTPAIVRVIHPPRGSGPATIPRVPAQPGQVLRSEIDRWWPANTAPDEDAAKSASVSARKLRAALPKLIDAPVATKDRASPLLKMRGPRPTKRNAAAAKMVADIQAGKQTLDDLYAMKQDSLARDYGLNSRDTARKALAAAAAEIVAISNSDK